MDALDNLIYSALNPSQLSHKKVEPVLIPQDIGGSEKNPTESNQTILSYGNDIRNNFIHLDDPVPIEDTIRKHWFDVSNRMSYTNEGARIDKDGKQIRMYGSNGSDPQAFIKFNVPPYHMIFSYLVENTRIAQIFEKMIGMYMQDEALTKADPHAFRWIHNTEALFYESCGGSYPSNVSQLRPVSEAVRRNAYFRMFGMELAFGDIGNNKYEYHKASFTNSGFISLFENFLIEFWKGYINASNTSGANTTDTQHLEELARKLQEMLMSRRSTSLSFTNYKYFNLSKEEYTSYIFMYWLYHAVSADTPVVKFLKAEANTAGERLMNIGRRVGLQAHTKSIAILDIAQPMSTLLRSVEVGIFNNSNYIFEILRANVINSTAAPAEKAILNTILLIINNWEKATGHRIKDAENFPKVPTQLNGSISGQVKVQANGSPKQYSV